MKITLYKKAGCPWSAGIIGFLDELNIPYEIKTEYRWSRPARPSSLIVLDTSIVNLALARIGTEFNSSLATWQWLVDGYALVFASLLLGAGALGDRVGAEGTAQKPPRSV